MANDNHVVMENVRIIFRNFAGKEGQYNREGDRTFGVILPDDVAEAMANDGWNVKLLKAQEEGEPGTPWLPVAVNFRGRPPQVVMITSRGRTNLDEDSVVLLDYADISNVDLIVNPYEWKVQDKSGVKAYLSSIFVTVEENELDRKYAHLEDAAPRREPGGS